MQNGMLGLPINVPEEKYVEIFSTREVVPPLWAKWAFVTAIAGGSGGVSGGTSLAGEGGQAGERCYRYRMAVSPGVKFHVTIGTGGGSDTSGTATIVGNPNGTYPFVGISLAGGIAGVCKVSGNVGLSGANGLYGKGGRGSNGSNGSSGTGYGSGGGGGAGIGNTGGIGTAGYALIEFES